MKIGIVNAGNIGRTLAEPWLKVGHQLKMAKAGKQEKLDAFLDKHPRAMRGSEKEAVEFGDVVLFSVYWPNFESTLDGLGDFNQKIVIDTMNPLNVNQRFEHYHDLDFMRDSSTSEELQRRIPKARVVKAFSTMPFQVLKSQEWKDNRVAPGIFLAGDNHSAKAVVAQLVKDAGFEPLDAGALVNARYIESLGVLLHHVGVHQFQGDYQRLAPTFLKANLTNQLVSR